MELQVQKREKLGRGVKALRKQGFIPAELYGKGVENLHLAAPAKEFKKLFKQAGENTIVNVVVGKDKHPVLIQDVSYNYLTGDIENVDFYQVRMDEKIKVGIPLEFVGAAPAVKEKSGILVKALQEVEIEALPLDIPHDFKVDLSGLLDIGQSVYVKNLEAVPGVKILVEPETVIATVTAQVTEEEEIAAQQAAAAGVEEVKVEAEEKKAEREAEKTAGEKAAPVAEAAKETPKK